ncbi:hypothetical protein H0H87_000469 [Tephrocybe sp. NHM501043]|nr:hypothetical protein H0H87_000469 [Tephrocybe sp. NHM501043]
MFRSDRLAQISDEKAAAEQQRQQLQAEVDRLRLRESTLAAPPAVSETEIPGSGSGPAEQQVEALRQRILELELQQRDLEDQLFGTRPPPGYSS